MAALILLHEIASLRIFLHQHQKEERNFKILLCIHFIKLPMSVSERKRERERERDGMVHRGHLVKKRS